jgi:hypothetical protein
MDDRSIPPSFHRPMFRTCESGRLQKQLLARAYQQVCPEAGRTLVNAVDPARLDRQRTDGLLARRLAQGA